MTKDKVYRMEVRMNCVKLAQEIIRPVLPVHYATAESPSTSLKNPSIDEIFEKAKQIFDWINK